MLPELDDNELVRLFKDTQQREKAFTSIVKKYQEKIYWQIRRIVITHQDADDVMQNVFIKAWNGLNNFREDAKLYTWIYRIAVNESLTYLEQQKEGVLFPLTMSAKAWRTKCRAKRALMRTRPFGNYSWLLNNYLKNNALYSICVILMRCLTRKWELSLKLLLERSRPATTMLSKKLKNISSTIKPSGFAAV